MLASPPLPKISYVVHAISVKWQQEGLPGSPLELLLLSLLLLTFGHWAMQRTLSNFCCLLPPRPIVLQRHKKRMSAKYSPQGVYQEILSLGMIFPICSLENMIFVIQYHQRNTAVGWKKMINVKRRILKIWFELLQPERASGFKGDLFKECDCGGQINLIPSRLDDDAKNRRGQISPKWLNECGGRAIM